MILFVRILVLFLCFCQTILFAQKDIYNLSSSKQYANYLYQSGDYYLANQEYERIVFLDSLDQLAKIRLVQSHRFLKNYDIAITKLNKWKIDDSLFSEEYIKLLLLSNQLEEANSFLETSQNFSTEKQIIYQVATSLLAYDIEKATILLSKDSITQSSILKKYQSIITDINQFKSKKIGFALPMSILIPGTGKMYVGYWKDGLFSFLLTTMSAWQAHRAFSQRGVKSAYAWIYTGLATGFYIGNLYGTIKSVRKFNNDFKHKNIHRIEKITFSTF